MSKTIFFSWQSDTPADIGKDFIKGILEDVCAAIASDVDVDETTRNITVDNDTKGVAG